MPNTNQEATGVVTAPVLPRVNLLPPEIAAAAKFRRFQFAMGGAVVAAVVIVGGLYVHGQSAVKSAQSDLDTAKAEYATAQQQLQSLQSVADVYSQVAAKEAMLQAAMGQEIRWSNYLADLSLRIPDRVWLESITATETATGLGGATAAAPAGGGLGTAGIGTINFTGKAFAHDDVATWLDMLAKERGFADAYFTNSTKSRPEGQRKLIDFASSVTLTDQAKSGHYTKPAGS
jgi:Tfp pilus assembly protein PilN